MNSKCIAVIDTPQFQRLRDLKQLGVIYLTFPGAVHSRFEHSVGVGHLAELLMKRFQRDQAELNITHRDIHNVTVAGLIHDLGHGPFSHSFEKWIKMYRPEIGFHHERMSQMMFQHLIEDNYIDFFEEDDILFINELISGKYSKKHEDKAWMFEIVANRRNSVDVDKFDYLARDSYNCGIKSSYDSSRLMIFSRVINNEICYHHKEGWNLNSLFNTRYSLFKQVYSHKVGVAIEHMVADALTLADKHMKISERSQSPATFTHLTDCIIKTIEASTEAQLEESRKLIKRIRRRDLYKCVEECIVPGDKIQHFKVPSAAEVVSGYSSDGLESLSEDDVIVDTHINNYALKDKNPIDSIHWFSKWEGNESFSLSQKDISLLAPSTFSEKYIRIYCRQKDKIAATQNAWRNYLRKTNQNIASPEHLYKGRFESGKKKLF
uniref:HD/PDEase domain-containing protein n=1 Tax=Arcella intermedia TaxID=1963864 RepID=A0A6B2L412_9EUKA